MKQRPNSETVAIDIKHLPTISVVIPAGIGMGQGHGHAIAVYGCSLNDGMIGMRCKWQ